jgi:hypothetical protein
MVAGLERSQLNTGTRVLKLKPMVAACSRSGKNNAPLNAKVYRKKKRCRVLLAREFTDEWLPESPDSYSSLANTRAVYWRQSQSLKESNLAQSENLWGNNY